MKMTDIFKSLIRESADSYIVQYVTGGWANWKVKTVRERFTAEQAASEIADLAKMGYHAVKFKADQFAKLGGLPSSEEFETPEERKKYYQDMIKNKSKIREAGLDTGDRTLGGSYRNREQSVFSFETIQDAVSKLNSKINAPVAKASYSTLGGERDSSILLALSIDPKESWGNGIYENSRYMRFHIQQDGVIEQFRISHKIPLKFRKVRAKSMDDVVAKINAYLSKVQGQ